MDIQNQILLNSYKNVDSVITDSFIKIELSNKSSKLIEYDITNILSATDIFDAEREANENYRIYGKIEYLSMLNGLKNQYTEVEDFFLPQNTDNKNILNSFEFYLVKPTTGYTEIISDSNNYLRYFEVIATPNDFELFPAGFGDNVFGEQNYCFIFNKDFDISLYYDNFNFPLVELFLYAKYIPKGNGFTTPSPENLYYSYWNPLTGIKSNIPLNTNSLNIGDKVYGDLITYNKPEFKQTVYSGQTYYIRTPYNDSNNQLKNIVWKYNPFLSFRLRYFSNDLYSVNTGSTTYELTTSIPIYATFDEFSGNYVWRDILAQGYIDPISNVGVDYPFINKKRYLFSNIILTIVPDLTDTNTNNVFNKIKITTDTLNVIPIIDNLNDLGKPCQ